MMHYAANHHEYVKVSAISVYDGPEGAYAAFALAALYGGNPLVYDGEEIAWPSKIPFFTRTTFDRDTGQDSLRQFSALLQLLNTEETLRKGELHEFGNDDVIAFTRRLGKKGFLVVVNVRNMAATFRLPEGDGEPIPLRPYEVRITRFRQ